MTAKEQQKLDTILAKVETLQNTTKDQQLMWRLQEAKTALLKAYSLRHD